jgi:hypothetical protein
MTAIQRKRSAHYGPSRSVFGQKLPFTNVHFRARNFQGIRQLVTVGARTDNQVGTNYAVNPANRGRPLRIYAYSNLGVTINIALSQP